MVTEFYKRIPEGIKEKLAEYCEKYSVNDLLLEERQSISGLFTWESTTEGYDFWEKHLVNNTFPIWSEELNRFINPPTEKINTITVNADEYQAMRGFSLATLKYLKILEVFDEKIILIKAKNMGIDINEIESWIKHQN